MAGTISRGIKAPIIREGDDIVKIVYDSVVKAMEEDNFQLHDKDIIAVTEAVVARADGNYCTVDDIARDVMNKFGGKKHIGVVFPIMSRNRFAICLRGIARGASKVTVQFSFPSDEEGNSLVDRNKVYEYEDGLFSEEAFYACFGKPIHLFTGVNYVDYYREIIESEGAEAEFIFGNRPTDILLYTTNIICCNIHDREYTRDRIWDKDETARVLTLADIMDYPINDSGYNSEFGLLGSNKATEEKIKLFPKNAPLIANSIQAYFWTYMGVKIEAMVYGDGAFKDPVGKIWELADPVVSPGFTKGLLGLPNELKLKYLADNEFKELSGDELTEAIRARIKEKDGNLKGEMDSQGTTPRHLTDLIGSLCDLTSGSGDKGTPIVVVQNYFNNYAD